MKTLAQVEPRIPITNAPFTISQPGSYYLTTNLSTTGDGVVIQAARVTLDLMGFSITGDGGTGDYGIHVSGTSNAMLSSIAVRGGVALHLGIEIGIGQRHAIINKDEHLWLAAILGEFQHVAHRRVQRRKRIAGEQDPVGVLDGDRAL